MRWFWLALIVFGFIPCSLPAADSEEKFEAARVHLQKGRAEEALEVYEDLAKAKADPAKIAVGQSRCHESVGNWKQATQVLEAAVKVAEKDAALWARLAEVQFAQGQFAATASSVQRALKLNANLPAARLVQADLSAATGKLKDADEQYRWFVRFYNQTQPEDPETLLLVARGAAQHARWHSVPEIFDFALNTLCPDALAKDKLCWQAHAIAGTLLLEKFNRAEGLPELKQSLTINPQAAEVYATLAASSMQEHDLTDAEQYADRALQINPSCVPALHVKADLKLDVSGVDDALKILESALAVNPHDEHTLARIAACYLFLDGAKPAEIQKLLANLDNPDEAAIDQPSRFAGLVIDLAKRNPHPGVFLSLLGETLESRRNFELAERCYKASMQTMPLLSDPKTALGMLYMRIGKVDEARKIMDAAFDADPYHVRVSNMRKVLKLLEGYEAISTEHFVIRIDSQADKILGKYMAEYLEEEYPALVKHFGYEPATRTQFEIFNKGKGLSAHQWFSARMIGLPWIQTIGASTGMIVALASPTATDKPFNWARVLKHEFVHILTLQKTGFAIPHWFTEALAVMSEGYARPETWNQLLLERVPKGDLMNLDTVNQGFIRPKTPLDWQMAYCQSQLYAQYMIEKFGADKISLLLDAYRDKLTTDQAIPKVFGVKKEEFEKGYREYLNQLVSQLRGEAGDEKGKLADFEKAHLAKPDDSRAAARYAYELYKLGKRKQARELAEPALEKNKAEPLAAVVMAQLEVRGEDLDAAAKWLEPAVDRSHPHPKALELLAQIRMKQEKYGEAASLYELGVEHFPSSVTWLKGLAVAYLKGKQRDKLKPVLEKLATMEADDASVRQKLAQMALDEKLYGEAVKYGRLALHVDVLDVDTHRILAQAYGALKQPAKAVDEWSVAVQLKPADPDLQVELARAQAAAGKKDAALKQLKAILQKKPSYEPAAKLLKEIEDSSASPK